MTSPGTPRSPAESRGTTSRLLITGGSFAALVAVNAVLSHLNREKETLLDILPIVLAFALFALAGALVIARSPRNRLGWLLVALGLGTMIGNVCQSYGAYAVITSPGSLPLGVHVHWLGAWVWPASVVLILVMPLYYPDGRLPSPRWRVVQWVAVLGYVGMIASIAFRPGPLGDNRDFPADNPFGIRALEPFISSLGAGVSLLLLVFVVGIGSLFVRARRADGDTRQQLKWFAYAGLTTITLVFVSEIIGSRIDIPMWLDNAMFAVALGSLPVGLGIAVSKYRLYDIDLVINRTLVYGLLTLGLGGCYLGAVVVLQRLLPLSQDSDVAVAASTLAVAALFRPARRVIQRFIDLRFYRAKYDAAQTLQDLSARLRNEVALDAASHEVLRLVTGTLHPTHASLWMRPPPERAGD